MIAFVINLDSRKDRWDSVLSQRDLLSMPLNRISAVTTEQLSDRDVQYAAPGVAATWLSHKKAAREFLATDHQYALILEDDFQLVKPLEFPTIEWLSNNNVDFLQIGFLHVTKWESIDIAFINFRDLALRFLRFVARFSRFINRRFSPKLLIRELPTSSLSLVPTDIRPGGHCYLISRNFAASMQELNNPIIFSADELFVSISRMRVFGMLRFRRSKVRQNDLPSSVTLRFKQKSD
jgi:hypothetical protein